MEEIIEVKNVSKSSSFSNSIGPSFSESIPHNIPLSFFIVTMCLYYPSYLGLGSQLVDKLGSSQTIIFPSTSFSIENDNKKIETWKMKRQQRTANR